jgi:hypothetical protein
MATVVVWGATISMPRHGAATLIICLGRVGRGKIGVHQAGRTRTCASAIERGETRALSLALRLQGSGEAELVPRSSDSPGLMPGLPKRSWAFFAKADDQALTVLWITKSV